MGYCKYIVPNGHKYSHGMPTKQIKKSGK